MDPDVHAYKRPCTHMNRQTFNHISLRLDSKEVTEQQKLDIAITEHCTWVTS